jgi:hypothetical protein
LLAAEVRRVASFFIFYTLDESREIVRKDATAVAAGPGGFGDFNMVPVNAAAGADDLQAEAAISRCQGNILRANWEAHAGSSIRASIFYGIL